LADLGDHLADATTTKGTSVQRQERPRGRDDVHSLVPLLAWLQASK
jgi:poly(3-hydroxybutyrate) depolymerase